MPATVQGNKNRNSSAVAWTSLTAESLGNLITPSPANGLVAVCTGAGTTGGSQPAWTTAPFPTLGTVFTDGSVQWTIVGTQPGHWAPIIQEPVDTDPPLAYAGVLPDTTLADQLAWITANAGILSGVNTWTGANTFINSTLTALVTMTQQSSGVVLDITGGTGGNPAIIVNGGSGTNDGIDSTGGFTGGHGVQGIAQNGAFAGVYGINDSSGPGVLGASNSGFGGSFTGGGSAPGVFGEGGSSGAEGGVFTGTGLFPGLLASSSGGVGGSFLGSATRGAIQLGGTSTRPSTPSAGEVIYNGTTNHLEYWNGSAWVTL